LTGLLSPPFALPLDSALFPRSSLKLPFFIFAKHSTRHTWSPFFLDLSSHWRGVYLRLCRIFFLYHTGSRKPRCRALSARSGILRHFTPPFFFVSASSFSSSCPSLPPSFSIAVLRDFFEDDDPIFYSVHQTFSPFVLASQLRFPFQFPPLAFPCVCFVPFKLDELNFSRFSPLYLVFFFLRPFVSLLSLLLKVIMNPLRFFLHRSVTVFSVFFSLRV